MGVCVRLAVLGAGAIGRRHAELVAADPQAELAAVVDPAPAGAELAARLGVRWEPALGALLARDRPDGAIVATPNRLHVEQGLAAVAAGVPALIEKPIADDVAEARRLVTAATAAGVPLLVGHHRRHSPMLRAARDAIVAGRIGRVLAVHAMTWFAKPDSYFAPAWRRQVGAGPVLVNLIHDLDALRFLCGEVAAVQAVEAHDGRGFEVEDTAAVVLTFACGAIATISVSDAVAAPWSWELTSGENPDYPRHEAFCYLVGGMRGSLSIPSLELFVAEGAPDWQAPMRRERLDFAPADPLAAQIANFCDVIRGRAVPVVPACEGLRTLEVVAAVKRAARSGERVVLEGAAAPGEGATA